MSLKPKHQVGCELGWGWLSALSPFHREELPLWESSLLSVSPSEASLWS